MDVVDRLEWGDRITGAKVKDTRETGRSAFRGLAGFR
jgi:hypothetical protein